MENMEKRFSRERVLCWIAKKISMDGENASWVMSIPLTIGKANIEFLDKTVVGYFMCIVATNFK